MWGNVGYKVIDNGEKDEVVGEWVCLKESKEFSEEIEGFDRGMEEEAIESECRLDGGLVGLGSLDEGEDWRLGENVRGAQRVGRKRKVSGGKCVINKGDEGEGKVALGIARAISKSLNTWLSTKGKFTPISLSL